VDISEAWKAKEKEDYFFGSVDANRVQFSTGRDVALSPKQDGPVAKSYRPGATTAFTRLTQLRSAPRLASNIPSQERPYCNLANYCSSDTKLTSNNDASKDSRKISDSSG
jgi:hypothetical protein